MITAPTHPAADRVRLAAALGAWRLSRLGHGPQTASPSDPLTVDAVVQHHLPTTRGGAEQSLHDLLVRLAQRGVAGRILSTDDGWTGCVDGIPVEPLSSAAPPPPGTVIFTQTGGRTAAFHHARRHARPVVVFQRSRTVSPVFRWIRPDLYVFNADRLAAELGGHGPRTVVHPTVDADRYRVDGPGDRVAIVGLSTRKGGDVFWQLATAEPGRQFLAVRNAWGDQIVPDVVPANVEVVGPVADMREVYARTSVVLMPSTVEPFGRVGLEAAVSGIPTIAAPLPGPREALGDAALYAQRNDIEAWRTALALLDDPIEYARRSAAALDRSNAFDPDDEVDELLTTLHRLTHPPDTRSGTDTRRNTRQNTRTIAASAADDAVHEGIIR